MVSLEPSPQLSSISQKLASINEHTWLQLGTLAELMLDHNRAISAYEASLRHNPRSVSALEHIASLYGVCEQFPKAVPYLQQILNIEPNRGDIWGSLGHCFLMMDDLQKAHIAYQQALNHLPHPRAPKLWYGIGILYNRCHSLEHAQEAFSTVLRMDPMFEKAQEIHFRLGMIYKEQKKFEKSLQCFQHILHSPPPPFTSVDIWLEIGHVYEQQQEFQLAIDVYSRILSLNRNHAKTLQQLGKLFHQQDTPFTNQNAAISYLTRSLTADRADAQTWHLLGRCYMTKRNHNQAHEAYKQAVSLDEQSPALWCSIGVLYYQNQQYSDALDAYSRAIRINPYMSRVWYNLGALYESDNFQVKKALEAYQRAAELDSNDTHTKKRIQLLMNTLGIRSQLNAPVPQGI
ncbi:TPR-like protein, partial [Basidiobolus meristosporus CBS 931.73]